MDYTHSQSNMFATMFSFQNGNLRVLIWIVHIIQVVIVVQIIIKLKNVQLELHTQSTRIILEITREYLKWKIYNFSLT